MNRAKGLLQEPDHLLCLCWPASVNLTLLAPKIDVTYRSVEHRGVGSNDISVIVTTQQIYVDPV